jgi:hypothetical protein
MGTSLLLAGASHPLASSSRSELLEPVLAFLAVVLFVVMAMVWRRRAYLPHPWAPWKWVLFWAAGVGLLVIAGALMHDWLYPSQAFRSAAMDIGLTGLVLGLLALFWYVLRGPDRNGVVADFDYRGATGRSMPSLIALVWCGSAALWYGFLFSGPSVGTVTFLALLGVAVFGILVVTTETFAQPRFMVPVVLQTKPGRLEAWLARRERRKVPPGTSVGARPKHRLAVPELVTVILEPNGHGGWEASSTDIDDFEAEAASLAELDALTLRDIQTRFANPGGGVHHLHLQFLCESPNGESATIVRRKDVLFDVSPVDGGYEAQSVDDAGERYQGKTLEDLMRSVTATGVRGARFTWQRDLEL